MTKTFSLILVYGIFIGCLVVFAKAAIDYFSKEWKMIILGYFLGFLIAYIISVRPDFSNGAALSSLMVLWITFALVGSLIYSPYFLLMGFINEDITPLLLIAIWYPLYELSKIKSELKKLVLSTALTGAAFYSVFLVAFSTYKNLNF